MGGLVSVSRGIDRFSEFVGIIANFLVLIAALVSAFNAFIRYGINFLITVSREYKFLGGIEWFVQWYSNNSNSFLEAQWYMFAGMVLLGAAFTLRVNEHVRVDLIYSSVGARTRTWIDLLGGIFFLLPMCIVLMYFTWPWFLESFYSGEQSTNAGGLTRWPVKLVLPVGFGLVALQGVSEIIKCIASLRTGSRREFEYERPVQ